MEFLPAAIVPPAHSTRRPEADPTMKKARRTDSLPFLSAREVEGLVADGRLIVVYEGHALSLDGWIDKHPGGRLAILHMVGRDATDEINA